MAISALFYTSRNKPIGGTKYIADVSRTFAWNDVGTAAFKMARSLPNVSELLAWGNIVKIVEPGLPTWVGQVEDRQWSGGGVDLNLKSMEAQLDNYITDQGLVFGTNGGATSAEIVRGVTLNAWGNGWTPLNLGGITGTKKHFKQYDYVVLGDAIRDLAEADKAAFWIDENLLLQYGPERGVRRSNLLLRENIVLVNVTVTESKSEVLTNILALGKGNDLVDQPKLTVGYNNLEYYRAEVVDFSDAVDQLHLREPALGELRKRVAPTIRVEADIVNRNNLWASIRVGDMIPVGVYTDKYVVLEAKIVGQELTSGQAMRCVFEWTPETRPVEPTEWRIS